MTPANPFSDSMVARSRIVSATEIRTRELAFQSNFNEMDQDMGQYSLENTRPAAEKNIDYSVDNLDEID